MVVCKGWATSYGKIETSPSSKGKGERGSRTWKYCALSSHHYGWRTVNSAFFLRKWRMTKKSSADVKGFLSQRFDWKRTGGMLCSRLGKMGNAVLGGNTGLRFASCYLCILRYQRFSVTLFLGTFHYILGTFHYVFGTFRRTKNCCATRGLSVNFSWNQTFTFFGVDHGLTTCARLPAPIDCVDWW